VTGLFEAHVRPTLAGVDGLVDAIAPRRTLTVVRFAQTTLVFDEATARSPIDIIPSTWSNTGDQDTPPFTLLKTPPVAVPT
jgi:hypothetical protein